MEVDLVEEELLSMVAFKPEVFELLQIKPKYLEDKSHQVLLEAMIYSREKIGSVSLAGIAEFNPDAITTWSMAVADEYIPIIKIKNQFMACQKYILNRYKNKVIADLTEKLKNGKLNTEQFQSKISKISDIEIKDETTVLSEEEIRENIDISKTEIIFNKFNSFGKKLKFSQTDFLIIGATTGTGKSGLLINLMDDLMEKYQCVYFNMEMAKSTIYKRMISVRSGLQVYDVETPKTEYQKNLIDKAIKSIAENKVIIEHKATSLSEIKAIITKNKDLKKHTIIFLDHIGLVKGDNVKSLYEQTTEVAKKLRQFCLDYDCTLIAASQLNRASYNSNELSLSMLKDSGELENSASKVILLYKNKENISKEKFKENMFLDIVKNREGEEGQMPYIYDKTKQIFKEDINYAS